jgi:hypothetical protein
MTEAVEVLPDERDAYQWWNSHLSVQFEVDRPPELVIPSVARSVWAQTCPIFLLFVINENDVQKYWDSIHAITAMFDPLKTLPSPVVNFPQFIARLHSIQDVLKPRTVTSSLNLIDRFGFHDSAHCFLYQCPVFLLDPCLYLHTILSLRQTHHHLWSSFATNPRLVDGFFRLYGTFITPVKSQNAVEAWRHRSLITEVLAAALEDVASFHSGIAGLVAHFLDLTIPLLTHAGVETGINILRPILGTIRFFVRQIGKDFIQSRVALLLNLLDRSQSIHFAPTVRFLLPIRPVILTHSQVCQLITSRPIRDLSDFDLIDECCDALTVNTFVFYLARSAVQRKLWHRACMSALVALVDRCIDRADVRDWFCTLVRRLFVFVSLAWARGKYRERSLLICESLAGFRKMSGWKEQFVTTVASVAARSAPQFFRLIFPWGPTLQDDVFLKEVELYAGIGRVLKAFPFDPFKPAFLPPTKEEKFAVAAPVTQRSSCRKIKVLSPPPGQKKKGLDRKGRKHHVTVRKTQKNTLPVHPVSLPAHSPRKYNKTRI